MTEVRITMRHMREMRYCASGVRTFFTRHSLDYTAFLKSGIPAEQLAATGDAMASKVVEFVRGRQ